MYQDGVFITEIARRTGFGTTTIFRWAQEAGVLKSFSERLAGSVGRQFGREIVGKKGVFHTVKGGAWIHTDSTYEFARLEQIESMPGILVIDRCRDRIEYHFDGVRRTYTPDFRLEFDDGRVVIEEIKPERYLPDLKVTAKIEAAQVYYRARGIVFRVVVEKDIGADRIKACSEKLVSRHTPEHAAAVRERRRQQKAVAQKAYIARKRDNATPEEMSTMRATASAFMRKYRAIRKQKQVAS